MTSPVRTYVPSLGYIPGLKNGVSNLYKRINFQELKYSIRTPEIDYHSDKAINNWGSLLIDCKNYSHHDVIELSKSVNFQTQLSQKLSSDLGFCLLNLPPDLSPQSFSLFTQNLFGKYTNAIFSGGARGSHNRHVCHTDWSDSLLSLKEGAYPVLKPSNFITAAYYKITPSTGGIAHVHHTKRVLQKIQREHPQSFRHFFDRDCVRSTKGSISPLLLSADFGKITLQFYETDTSIKEEAYPAYRELIQSLSDSRYYSLITPKPGLTLFMIGGIIHSRSSCPEGDKREVFVTTHSNPNRNFKFSIL